LVSSPLHGCVGVCETIQMSMVDSEAVDGIRQVDSFGRNHVLVKSLYSLRTSRQVTTVQRLY